MIPRFSLYGTVDQWSGDIQEDPTGRWAKWLDVEEYVQYALEQGFTPPTTIPAPQARTGMVEQREARDPQQEFFTIDTVVDDERDVGGMIAGDGLVEED